MNTHFYCLVGRIRLKLKLKLSLSFFLYFSLQFASEGRDSMAHTGRFHYNKIQGTCMKGGRQSEREEERGRGERDRREIGGGGLGRNRMLQREINRMKERK